MNITYKFVGADTPTTAVEVKVDRSMSPRPGRSEWAKLEYRQCKNCPLPKEAFPYCPAAVDLEPVIEAFNQMLETEEVDTEVTLPGGRKVHWHGDTRVALGSLLGLIMASSPCPILSRLKGLAMTHVPFQSQEEEVFRFASAYLLGQLVEARHGHQANWSMDGLRAVLDDLETLNLCFLDRLHEASEDNPAIDSIKGLLSRTTTLRDSLDASMPVLEQYSIPPVPRAEPPGEQRAL